MIWIHIFADLTKPVMIDSIFSTHQKNTRKTEYSTASLTMMMSIATDLKQQRFTTSTHQENIAFIFMTTQTETAVQALKCQTQAQLLKSM